MVKVTDLREKFDLLRSFPDCAAYMRRTSLCWQDQQVAHKLGVDPAVWSRMKNGGVALDVAQGALLLELCGIRDVSGDVFYQPMADFKRVLEPVGLGGRQRFGALYTLWKTGQDRGLSIQRPPTRGLASGTPDALSFRIGEAANIVIDHPSGGFLVLFEIGPEKIELVVPSRYKTDTALPKGHTMLPVKEDHFTVGGPPGSYWLLAAITESRPRLPTWAAPDSFEAQGQVRVLDERAQMNFVALLQECQRLEIFVLSYGVIRSEISHS